MLMLPLSVDVYKRQRIYFDGNSVKEIYVDGRGEIRPGSPGRPGQEEYCPDSQYDRVMSEQLFKKFLSEVKKEPFKDDRMEMIKTALAGSDFTSGQCLVASDGVRAKEVVELVTAVRGNTCRKCMIQQGCKCSIYINHGAVSYTHLSIVAKKM